MAVVFHLIDATVVQRNLISLVLRCSLWNILKSCTSEGVSRYKTFRVRKSSRNHWWLRSSDILHLITFHNGNVFFFLSNVLMIRDLIGVVLSDVCDHVVQLGNVSTFCNKHIDLFWLCSYEKSYMFEIQYIYICLYLYLTYFLYVSLQNSSPTLDNLSQLLTYSQFLYFSLFTPL